jgi:two-component system nitrate/nitrite response regulator NarL
MRELRVLITADDPLARAGLATLLASQPDCVVVGQVTPGDLAGMLDIYRPDVILWDSGWEAAPGAMSALRSALDRLAEYGESAPPVAVLLPDDGIVAAVWSAGVRGMLPREIGVEQLVAALHSVAHQLAVIDPAFASAVIPDRFTPADGSGLQEDITPREKEVLQLLAEGLPNKAIALRLGISEHTVKFHINALMGKLGAQSRTDAVVRATRRGLLIL